MKKTMLGSACAALLLLSAPAAAQMRLPAASPAAKVEQAVGLTDVSVEYSSPAVKGRPIWGALVPYGQPWRTGANMATKVTFSRDVTFGGKRVPAGSYALVTFPTQQGWTVALNKELGLFGGGKSYDAKLDVAKVPATTSAIPHRERLTFLFANTTDDTTSLDLEWEKLRVSVPVKADTAAHVKASIAEGMESTWRTPASAARYLLDQKDFAGALKLAETSIGVKSTWFNQWTRAQALAGLNRYADAHKAAQTSWELGNKDPGFFFKGAVSKALTEWKGKQ